MTTLIDPLAPVRRRRTVSTASATGRLLDPFAAVDRVLETAAHRSTSVTYEVQLDPPRNANTMRTHVAGQYRDAVPILWDPATRTAYPIRNEG